MKTTKELVKFDIETAVITALDAEYKEVQKITDAKSKAIIAEGRRKYRELRLAVVAGHKDEKGEALDYCNFLDAEKRRILGLLAPGESYLNDIWQAHKDEIDRKEKERIEAIQEKINRIRAQGIGGHNVPSSLIQERIIITQGMPVGKDVFMEFTEQAEEARKEAITILEEAFTQRLQTEKEDAERKVEAEHLDTVRKLQEATQVKIDEEHRKIAEEKAKIEAEKKAEEDRKKQEEWEKDEKARILLELEERKAEAEQKQIEKEEAEAKEKARQEALRPDKEKLIKWIQGFNETAIPSPALKSKEAQRIMRTARENIEMVLQEAMTATEEL